MFAELVLTQQAQSLVLLDRSVCDVDKIVLPDITNFRLALTFRLLCV